MTLRLTALADRLRSSLWLIPGVFVIGAFLLAQGTLIIDGNLSTSAEGHFYLYGGDSESARSILSTIAAALMTFTALTFSVTMLVLQLASSQLSPRVLRTFLRDRGNQVVLGLFVSTLVFALLVLQAVRSEPDAFVPGLSIWAALVLLLACIGAFIYYIDHIANSIRATRVMDRVMGETQQAIDANYPDRVDQGTPDDGPRLPDRERQAGPVLVFPAWRSGVITGFDEDRLLEHARENGACLELVPAIGDWVHEDGPLLRSVGGAAPPDRVVRMAVVLAGERTVAGDPAYGFRQLVDIALRALSPSVNDPTTAIHAIDRLDSLLHRLLPRRIPPRERRVDGQVRLIVPGPDWEEFVELTVLEIARAAAEMPRVLDRLRTMLSGLLEEAPEPRRAPLARMRTELDARMSAAA